MWQDAVWLGVPHSELEKWNILEGDLTGRFAYYRCEVTLEQPGNLVIDITANSRYRLWINGHPVLSGPCKGDLYRHYYETVDVSKYLLKGKNVFAVQVLYNNAYRAVRQTDERAAIFGVLTPGGGHRLALEGIIRDENGNVTANITTGKADWKVYLEGSYYLKSTSVTENLGAVCEELDMNRIPLNWKKICGSADGWSDAIRLECVKYDGFEAAVGLLPRFLLRERNIPLLYEKEGHFEKELFQYAGQSAGGKRKTGILEQGEWQISAGEKRKLFLDAGVIVNGYPKFVFRGGKEAIVRITYFEKFISDTAAIRRDDAERGLVYGITDQLILAGGEGTFEPFWVRTFRFLCIEVENGQEELTVERPAFRKTGYPLEIRSQIASETPWVKEVWNMCVRTLENCMMETYMDCPYYEQMQFPMDTRLQALFTYAVSGDTRLAEKALEDFHCSLTPDGLIHGKYPSAYPQIISTFSLHDIYMLKEYYWQTGKIEKVRGYFPDIDRILNYYDAHIGESGMVEHLGYWEFVDWQPAWQKNGGVPEAALYGPSAIINLMYAYALKCAADLNETAGRKGMAEEYVDRRNKILQKVQETCWDENRQMYREGPRTEQYTCHAQAWAVLNELPPAIMAKEILKHAAEEPDVLKCTFSTAYEWFRACEQADVYFYTEQDMQAWIRLPELGCTCCPETPGDTRSDCHAWSALPMYELAQCMAGIKAQAAGWERIRIRPHMQGLNDLSGQVVTPKGMVCFAYSIEETSDGNAKWIYEFTLPEGANGTFVSSNGNATELYGGRQYRFAESL